VTAFQQDTSPRPTQFSRVAAGFTLHLIDTPSLLDQDIVSEAVRLRRGEGPGLAARVRVGRKGLGRARMDRKTQDRRRVLTCCLPIFACLLPACCLPAACTPHLTPPRPTSPHLPPLQKLEGIAKFIKDHPVDAVLYLDRLDNWKVDTLDRKVGRGAGAWAQGQTAA